MISEQPVLPAEARTSGELCAHAVRLPGDDEPRIEWMPLESIRRAPRNPKAHNLEALVRSFGRFGFVAPPMLNERTGLLVAGHGRIDGLLAAQRAGKPAPGRIRVGTDGTWLVPVLRGVSFASDADAELYLLADNKLSELGGWDDDALTTILADYRDVDPEGLNIAGWSDEELEALLTEGAAGPEAGEVNEAATDTPAEELQRKWGTALGQLWVCGRHRLVVGDSRDPAVAARAMGGAVARWMWTDPPYGVSYVGKTKDALEIENDGAADLPDLLAKAFAAADAVLGDGAPVYVAHAAGRPSVVFGNAFVAAGWHLHQTLAWVKDRMVLGRTDYHYKHEPILYGWKGANRTWFGGRDKVSVLEHPRPARSELHPTMKPVSLVVECLKNSAPAGSTGYEPFSGSGTTLVAAEQCGLACCAVELDPAFAAVAIERLSVLGVSCAKEEP